MKKVRWKVMGLLLAVLCAMVPANHSVVYGDSIPLGQEPAVTEEVTENADNFVELHKDDIKEYENEFEGDTDEKDINLWTYPYSDELVGEIHDSYDNLPFVYLYYADCEFMWGYIESKDKTGWICINEPNIPFFNRKNGGQSASSVQDSTENKAQGISEKQVVALVIGLIVGLISITGVLIKIFWKKEKK